MRNLAYLAYFWYLGGVMAGGIKTRVLVVGGAGYIIRQENSFYRL